MANRPSNMTWIGFTDEQVRLLELLDHVGNNGWSRNGQTEGLMPNLLNRFAELGVSIAQIKAAMASIGYDKADLHMLDRWESKRTTGKFGR